MAKMTLYIWILALLGCAAPDTHDDVDFGSEVDIAMDYPICTGQTKVPFWTCVTYVHKQREARK